MNTYNELIQTMRSVSDALGSLLQPLPGAPRPLKEVGIVLAEQRRPVYNPDGVLDRYDLVWCDYSHNERVNAGAQYQAQQCFGGGGSPAAPSATVYFNVIAVATTGFTAKDKADQSIGTNTANATTNEFTTAGLSRHTATSPSGGDYTAPTTLGGTFSQVVKYTFTASGSATAHGAAVYNSTTVSGSILYIEDTFSADASMLTNDTLSVTVTISN